MPHKRAKRTIREQARKERGSELAPKKESLRNEAIPKSAARVLNAQAIRDEWKLKKRKHEDESGGDGPEGKRRKTTGRTTGSGNKEKSRKSRAISLTIQPGESIQHFNRRVEDDLRPLVKSAVQASLAVTRNRAKAEKEAHAEAKKAKPANGKTKKVHFSEETMHDSSPPPRIDKHAGRPKEFQLASSSVPRRLNDIAKAPPEIKKFSRGASSTITGRADGVLSMSQKLMMDQERIRAIARYRELRAGRERAGDRKDKVVEDE
ncbi:hypothetical protein BYT27DRAFT_7113461 [Phlegmacium glaucopus]|nr:hypothetical protein BYT27DRAFT_7113461 [Phlegmacium glaucopus]